MRSRRLVPAGLVVVGLLVVAGVGSTAAAQEPTSVDDAVDRTDDVATLESFADRTLTQYLGGAGIGLGIGLVVGSVVVYRIQKSRIAETYE